MTRITLLSVVIAALLGCSTRDTNNVAPQRASDSAALPELTIVRKTVAELLNVPESSLRDDVAITELPMDDLDLVELVMELEDHYDIRIPDEEFAGEAGDNLLLRQITLSSIARIVQRVRDTN